MVQPIMWLEPVVSMLLMAATTTDDQILERTTGAISKPSTTSWTRSKDYLLIPRLTTRVPQVTVH